MAKKSMSFPVSVLADELGVSHETLRRGLRGLGVEVGHGRRYTIKQAFSALQSDLKAERTRETRARADLLELERREKEASLVPMSTARAVLVDVLTPLRTEMISCPATLAARCNPGDPEIARVTLEAWARETLQTFADAVARTTPQDRSEPDCPPAAD